VTNSQVQNKFENRPNVNLTAFVSIAWASAAGGQVDPWIFIHNTDKVKGGLMLLFYGLVLSVGSPPWNFFCRHPWSTDVDYFSNVSL